MGRRIVRERRLVSSLILALGLAAATPARAQDLASLELPRLEVHGFASQGFIFTSDNNYLARSERGSFEFSEAGLNLTAQLTDKLRTGVQAFARDLGPIGDYRLTLDWFYLDYRWQDWLGIRAGRVKLPFGLYNDVADIDAAHGMILLPQSLYPASNRDFLLAQTGVELYGYRPVGPAGAIEYRLYAGTIFLEVEDEPGRPFEVLDLNIPYVVGGRLMWEPPIEGLRASGSVQLLRLESDLLFAMEPMPVELDIPAVLWVASLEYLRDDWSLAAEYSRWHVEAESSDPMRFPESKSISERTYARAAYQVLPWLQGGAYYSLLFPDTGDRSGRDARQHDVAATVRFDINLHWLVKLEAHYMNGTAALDSSLNDGRDPSELARDWAVFLAKTTAHF